MWSLNCKRAKFSNMAVGIWLVGKSRKSKQRRNSGHAHKLKFGGGIRVQEENSYYFPTFIAPSGGASVPLRCLSSKLPDWPVSAGLNRHWHARLPQRCLQDSPRISSDFSAFAFKARPATCYTYTQSVLYYAYSLYVRFNESSDAKCLRLDIINWLPLTLVWRFSIFRKLDITFHQ